MSGWRPEIESALCLRLLTMMRGGSVRPGCITSGTWYWSQYGERIAAIGYRADLGKTSGTLILSYQADGQNVTDEVRLSTVQNHYGGRNWFMHCPYSGRRARCLYKWSRLIGFRHREAVHPKPTYASQRDSGMERIIRQRWSLRRKIGDDISDLFGEPMKPKWMRWSTFDKVAARDAELEEQEGGYLVSTLYRLGLEGF